MLLDRLLTKETLAGILRQSDIRIIIAPNAYGLCVRKGVDWNTERVSGRKKFPPGPITYFEYNFTDTGPAGTDNWTLGVLIRQVPAGEVARTIAASSPLISGQTLQFPEGTAVAFQADQFEVMNATRSKAGKSSKYPLGTIGHNMMAWCVCFNESGTTVRTIGLMSEKWKNPGPGNKNIESPFGYDRSLHVEKEGRNYYPLAAPWVPFAVFGLLNSGDAEGIANDKGHFIVDTKAK